VIRVEDILAHKLANDIGGMEDVVSCYVLEEGEVIGEEEGKDLKEIAVVQSALIGELCSNYISGRLKFSDYKAIVLKHEGVDIVVFFRKKTSELSVLSDVRDMLAGVAV